MNFTSLNHLKTDCFLLNIWLPFYMKSIIVVLGVFIFSIFVEGFIRIIVLFYHKTEFTFWGVSSLPSPGWAVALVIASLLIYWLSGMLVVTATMYSPKKHLLSLGMLLLLLKGSEVLQTYSIEPMWYLIMILSSPFIGLYLAYYTHSKIHEKNS
ncbi:MAG: hypothetical protein ED557_00810 [Balneola sp.]|nr:MAG: hypothetical protein ED557_00810 [Balneola sp.]